MIVECIVSAAGAVWGVLVAMMAPSGGGRPPPPPGTGAGRWEGDTWHYSADPPATAFARLHADAMGFRRARCCPLRAVFLPAPELHDLAERIGSSSLHALLPMRSGAKAVPASSSTKRPAAEGINPNKVIENLVKASIPKQPTLRAPLPPGLVVAKPASSSPSGQQPAPEVKPPPVSKARPPVPAASSAGVVPAKPPPPPPVTAVAKPVTVPVKPPPLVPSSTSSSWASARAGAHEEDERCP